MKYTALTEEELRAITLKAQEDCKSFGEYEKTFFGASFYVLSSVQGEVQEVLKVRVAKLGLYLYISVWLYSPDHSVIVMSGGKYRITDHGVGHALRKLIGGDISVGQDFERYAQVLVELYRPDLTNHFVLRS